MLSSPLCYVMLCYVMFRIYVGEKVKVCCYLEGRGVTMDKLFS